MLEQALEIGDNCDDHALKSEAYGGLAEVAMRDPMGKKTERNKLSQEYWRLQREEDDRAKKFPAKPPPPVQPAPPAEDEEPYEEEPYYMSKSQKKRAKQREKEKPSGRDRAWELLKEREAKDNERHEQEEELRRKRDKEKERNATPPSDLSTYKKMDNGGGWSASACSKWLYHEGSNVFLQQASGKYFRKNASDGFDEIRQQGQQKEEPQEKVVEEAPQEFTGIVKTVVANKGYGFIKQDGSMKDVWVKLGTTNLREGMKLRYKMGRVDGRDCAVDIVVESEPVRTVVVEEQNTTVVEEMSAEEEVTADDETSAPMFDVWGRPIKLAEEKKLEKEKKPAWDKELLHGVELLRGRQLVMEDYACREQLGTLGTMFGMFDGHGGREASEYCFNKFGMHIEKEFRKKYPLDALRVRVSVLHALIFVPAYFLFVWKAKTVNPTQSEIIQIISKGFLDADRTFLENTSYQEGVEAVRAGTTACVGFIRGTSVNDLQIITANVGDSRAVMCRGGKALRLSEDHKPDRKDEKRRIEGAGGSVLLIGESWRCTKGKEWGETRFKIPENQLLLATSRALGDREAGRIGKL